MNANDNDDDDLCFGGCPHCHQVEEHFNHERDHFGACHRHRVIWCYGANLFSSWQDETRTDWDAVERRFGAYRSVDAHYDAREPLVPFLGEAK